ncbi:MAG: glycosyltransferase family 4 protein, partial [Spirochaetaceae bacterium]|nr:glycosyltransferase family 4 protein [Spirochaetaceae bacterium]
MKEPSGIQKIAFLGDYLPRKCGIATFTTDLRTAVAGESPESQCLVIPVNDIEGGYDYPPEVRFEIEEQNLQSYHRAADFLNITDVDVLCVEHEFGIYGGPSGSHVLSLLNELTMPIVTTLHTILKEPSEEQRHVMMELIDLTSRLIVMTQKGCDLLLEVYGAPEAKIDIIPHGIPDRPFSDSNYFKEEFGVAGKHVLLTFGLLSPNKGIEYALKALPAIIKEFPNTVFIVVGQTHPNLLRQEGELYRLGLERLAVDLNIQKHVVFFNRFVGIEELIRFIGTTDIYITPYLTENQITSGTLAYAFGSGNAVISTPYWHAAELLADGRGKIVPFRDADAIAVAVNELLDNDSARHAMRRKAFQLGRDMLWSRIAQLYLESFRKAGVSQSLTGRKASQIRTLEMHPRLLPALKLNHLSRLSDSTGLFQHASFTVPRFEEGYCTDDNARGFLLTQLLQHAGNKSTVVNELAATYIAFLNYALDRKTHRFKNFMNFDRHWIEEVGSEDCQGQALWALGVCMGSSGHNGFQILA